MLWSSGRGYPERRGFPREEKTPARGLVRRRQTLVLPSKRDRAHRGEKPSVTQDMGHVQRKCAENPGEKRRSGRKAFSH